MIMLGDLSTVTLVPTTALYLVIYYLRCCFVSILWLTHHQNYLYYLKTKLELYHDDALHLPKAHDVYIRSLCINQQWRIQSAAQQAHASLNFNNINEHQKPYNKIIIDFELRARYSRQRAYSGSAPDVIIATILCTCIFFFFFFFFFFIHHRVPMKFV